LFLDHLIYFRLRTDSQSIVERLNWKEPMDSAQTHPKSENRTRLLPRLAMTAFSIVGIAACSPFSSPSVAPGNPAADSAAQPGTALTPVAANEFVFPQDSCGDRVTNPSATWYPVYIDGANIEDIRTKYCRDAVSTIRAISGQPSVQVASFTSYDKALRFSKLVGGEVEQLGNSLVTASGQASPTGAASPGTSPTEMASPSAGTALPSTTAPRSQSASAARAGSLTASDPDSPINVRASASTSAEVQHTGYPGDRLRIVSQSQGDDGSTWYNVQLESGQTGWVRSDFVSGGTATRPSTTATPGSSTALRPSPAGTTTGSTTSSNRRGALTAAEPDAAINVRDGAGMSASVQDVAYSGDVVRILGQQQGDDGSTWYNVQLESGQTGWVRSDFVSQN
jgi:Bacterial SH3 domain